VKQISTFLAVVKTWSHMVATAVPRRALRRLNRGVGEECRIEPRIVWPVWLIPVMLVNQLLAPHPVWVVLSVTLIGLYWVAALWVRSQVGAVRVIRRRMGGSHAGDGVSLGSGAALVAGDSLHEEFVLINGSALPVLWAELEDHSTVPDYEAGRVVACGAQSEMRWKSQVVCKRRGVFSLGPHTVRLQDPFGFFTVVIESSRRDVVLIYPRVVQMPPVLPAKAESQGTDRQRRPLAGVLPAATIAEYRPGDSLRYVHWASTARTVRLMVKDLEIEPGGDVWIVLDLDAAVQQGNGDNGTLEFGVVVAASVAAQLLHEREQRAVGLLAFGGSGPERVVAVSPGRGNAYLWSILTALAQVDEGDVSLADLLASNRDRFGRRSTIVLITPLHAAGADNDLIIQIAQIRAAGIGVQVVRTLAADHGDRLDAGDDAAMVDVLARLGAAMTTLQAGDRLTPLLTFRRRRTVLRSTPTGGVVRREIEEEVG
jgi:uncharacterized protein (DUF58 family)